MAPFFLLLALLLCYTTSPSFSKQRQQQQQYFTSFSSSDSPWLPTQNRTLLSPNSTFAAGFLALPTSPNQFNFSVWYFKLSQKTVVWSANEKASPLNGSASLVITNSSELLLIESPSGKNLWPATAKGNSSANKLSLREDGNLVFADWESFDHPTDTFLPGQSITAKILRSKNGKFRFLNSKSLVFGSDSYWNASNAFLRLHSDGSVELANSTAIISDDYEDPRPRRLTLDDDGILRLYSFDRSAGEWVAAWQAVEELCTVHGLCGPNAICFNDGFSRATSCVCPAGFRRNTTDPEHGCVRKVELSAKTKFLRLDYVSFTDGANESDPKVSNLSACQAKCLARNNCLGFMFKYDGQGFCVPLHDRLLYGYWSPGIQRVTFLRVDISEKDESNFSGMTSLMETSCPVNISLPLPPDEPNTTTRNIAIICTLFAAELISGFLFFWAFVRKFIKYRDMARTLGLELLPAGGPKRFTYAELKAATNDFSNAIGKGGFGDVYKGELPDKRVVAVKCLKHVTGGDAEFWAEVTIIARMHHLNLVRLWGYCAEKGRRILVYEYVPNGSLDKYLFPAGRISSLAEEMEMGPLAIDGPKPMLDWGIRYRISLGVARAIAYLHEECLEWVLHCDIKPENILLGDDFCPKISDFGLAKLRKKEDMVSMSRIRGTRGYMAPEWIKSDPITPKADVYSFGMVLLEIVTGSRNFDMQGSVVESEDWYFPRWVFDKVYKETKVEDILDRQIKHRYDNRMHFAMVDRMVKTAMWCLQDRPESRPSMGKVAKMLEGTVEITEPKKPTIFFLGDE
uniref:Receptor-like serine/threonine-protein kinase n=1 Tax=Rhizophora mucronata TaxID=61149 RepID=A0A2P2QM98_RHIMU